MPRKKETLTLSVPPGTKEQLEAIARRLGIFWGKSPSPSGLISAIAQAKLEVGKSFTLNSKQVKALRQATKDLIDAGHVEDAQSIIALLLDRGNLEAPLRQSLMQQVGKPSEPWRVLVEQQIEKKQPFRILYTNSQRQELDFTVRYAEICFYEKRFYLQVWCEETEDVENHIPDLPELWHNRCLRLDRIQTILPTSGEWRGEFDALKVYLQFQGWLVKAYEPKSEDVEDKVTENVRLVVRRVVNHFWFIREISRYWEDCTILEPESMRSRLKEKVKSMCHRYDIEIQE
ncbi:MAG: WYL domain-containing protein [Coleofasciculaceae cyanobacterium]